MGKKKDDYVERWRDAGNGQYIKPEEAKKRPPNEVVKERDKKKR
ncbi:hypothetical protein [Dysgonomonas mossii]|nr:hypothetical protein [Dysgonomonas mossii]